jgi:hypothetical protein
LTPLLGEIDNEQRRKIYRTAVAYKSYEERKNVKPGREIGSPGKRNYYFKRVVSHFDK